MEKSTRLFKNLILIIIAFVMTAAVIPLGVKSAKADNSWSRRETGDVAVTVRSDGFAQITGLSDWGELVYSNELVTIDKLALYFRTDSLGSAALGVGFAPSTNYYLPETKDYFNAVFKANSSWDLLFFMNCHDVDNQENLSVNYGYYDSGLSDKQYGMDSNQFYGFNKTDAIGVRIYFEKISESVYKLETTLTAGTDSGRNRSGTCYVSASNFPSNGQGYLSVWSVGAAGTTYVMAQTETAASTGGWNAKNNAYMNPTDSGLNMRVGQITANMGAYVNSDATFDVTNFEVTIRTSGVSGGDWWMFGLTNTNEHFNSADMATTAERQQCAGIFLMFKAPADSSYNTKCTVYTIEPNTKNFYVGERGYIEVKYSLGNIVKIRFYPDESGRYINISVNGRILRNQRVRVEDVKNWIFGEDGKGHVLFQSWTETPGNYVTLTALTINNKYIFAEDVATPSEENLIHTDEDNTIETNFNPYEGLGCAIIHESDKVTANSSSVLGGLSGYILFAIGGGVIVKKFRGGKKK